MKVNYVQLFLRDHSLIQGLVQIPIQLDALCYTWESFSGRSMPQTMTVIYKEIEGNLWKMNVVRLEKQIDGKRVMPSDVESAKMDQIVIEIYLLEGLAFTGLHNDIIYFDSESRNAISEQFQLPGVPGVTILLDNSSTPLLSTDVRPFTKEHQSELPFAFDISRVFCSTVFCTSVEGKATSQIS